MWPSRFNKSCLQAQWEFIFWSEGSLPKATSLKKMIPSPHSPTISCQWSLGGGLRSYSFLSHHSEVLIGPILFRSCADNHGWGEFMISTSMSYREDVFFCTTPQPQLLLTSFHTRLLWYSQWLDHQWCSQIVGSHHWVGTVGSLELTWHVSQITVWFSTWN